MPSAFDDSALLDAKVREELEAEGSRYISHWTHEHVGGGIISTGHFTEEGRKALTIDAETARRFHAACDARNGPPFWARAVIAFVYVALAFIFLTLGVVIGQSLFS